MIRRSQQALNLTVNAKVADRLGRTGRVTRLISAKRVEVQFEDGTLLTMYRTSLRYAA